MSEASYWAVLTAPILESTEVTDGAKLFYAQISRRTKTEGYCWASNRTLSEELGVTERTITRYVAELEAAGFIKTEFSGVHDRKRHAERRIRLAVPVPFNIEKNVHPSVDKNDGDNIDKNVGRNKVKNKRNKNNPPISPQGDERAVCKWNERRFLKFWKFFRDEFCAIDHSFAGERGKAAIAWDKLEPDDATISKMATKLKAIMQTQRWKEGFGIMMASTFLNGIRLKKIDLDDLPQATAPSKAPSKRWVGTKIVDGEEVDVYE